MQSSSIPVKFPVAFANGAASGFIRSIPQNPSGTPGQASLTQGFPPENFNPVAAGGVPPFGQDFNGLFNQSTSWSRWAQAGGAVPYDAAFQTAIGGYPLGAIIESAMQAGSFWLCTVENNITNPDAGGSGWLPINFGGQTIQFAVDTGAVNVLTVANKIPVISMLPGFTQAVLIGTTNTTAATLTVDGNTALSIVTAGGLAIGKGQLPSGGLGLFMLDNTSRFRLIAMIPPPGTSTPYAPKLIGVSLNNSGGTSLPSATNTILPMSVVQNNLYGNTAWNGTKLTVGSGEAGLWFLSGFIWLSTSPQNSVTSIEIWINGSQQYLSLQSVLTGNGSTAFVATIAKLNVGDFVQFFGFQQTSGTVNTQQQSATAFLISAF